MTELGQWRHLRTADRSVHGRCARRLPLLLSIARIPDRPTYLREEAGEMTLARSEPRPDAVPRGRCARPVGGQPRRVVQRGLSPRSSSWAVVSGLLRAGLLPASMGIGLGALIGTGRPSGSRCPTRPSSPPPLLAVSAMNRRDLRLDVERLLQAQLRRALRGMLATSLGPLDVALGEILYALLRGLHYATGFMIIMQIARAQPRLDGDPRDPAVLLIAFGFASLGMARHGLHEDVPADGLDQLRAAADVPVLGDAVPDHGLPRIDPDHHGASRCGTG